VFFVWSGISRLSSCSAATLRHPASPRSRPLIHVRSFVACDSPLQQKHFPSHSG
jgi:hypothetical protein